MLHLKQFLNEYYRGFSFSKYFFYLIPFLAIGLILAYLYINLAYESQIEEEFVHENRIDIEYAYVRNGGRLSVLTYDEANNYRWPLEFNSNEPLKPLAESIFIPYVFSHDIVFSFDAENEIIILHGIYINDKPIPMQDFENYLNLKNFEKAFYSEKDASLILHVSNRASQIQFKKKILNIIPKFTLQEEQESVKALEKAKFNEKLHILLLFFLIFTFLSLFILKKEYFKILNWTMLIFFVLAVDFSFMLLLNNELFILNKGDLIGNLNKYHQNYLPVLIIFIVMPLIFVSHLKNKVVKTLITIIPVSIIFIMLVDNFIISILDSRFIFQGSGLFIKQANYAIPFITKYLKSDKGLVYILALSLLPFLIILSFKGTFKLNSLTCSIIVLASTIYALYPVQQQYNDYKFANVFQINDFTFTNRGNYQALYSENYPPLKSLDFQWQTKEGMNLRKNIIILLVESLDCSLTHSCGSKQDLTPNITTLARENLFFDNYYSNNFNTHGAYLTIVKSLPFFPQKNMEFSAQLLNLYNENDLLEAFRKYGYKSSFFSSTDLVYGMDESLKLSNYDNIYTDKDPYYKNIKERYVFNSVPDENLYDYIAYKAKKETDPFIYITKSASSHSPFISPLGMNDFNMSFIYTDLQVKKFVDRLEQDGFFQNGILVITGDHKVWDPMNNAEKFNIDSDNMMNSNHVPLSVIDGIHKGEVNHTFFSHSSLGVYIQSLLLPEYKLNKFHADVAHSTEPETIIHYEYVKKNMAIVKKGDLEAEVLINGDRSEFLNKVFDQETETQILGYIAICHR